MLAPFSPARHHIALAVWPDSFAEFRLVRDHLVRRGFNYELLLIERDGLVGIGAGGSSKVQ
jgi:hypothetical protein